MKLTAGQIQGFLAAPPLGVRAFLFYGPDGGLVHERAEALARKLVPSLDDPFSVTQLSGAALGGDAARFYDETAAVALGGSRRLLRLHQATESNSAGLARFLSEPPACDSVVVIEAGDLDKRSKLRSLCEGPSNLAAGIPCYVEDSAARMRSIGAMLEAEKLRVSRDTLRFLADSLPPDRMALRSEIDKLALYAKGQQEITMESVRAVVAEAGGADIDDLVQAVASGEAARAMTLMDRLFEEQTSPVALLRAMQRHLMRLHLARGFMDAGASAGEALKKLSPPVFWKAVDPMTRQLARWTTPRLEARLIQLLEAEAAVKRTGVPDEALAAQLLLGMARRC